MALHTGAVLGGRYVVEAVLGRGTFAVVYRVRHAWLGTQHAAKLLHAGGDAEARLRLAAEGQMQARLAHPNLVRVTDVVELVDGTALVMDLVEGETLRDRLVRGRVHRCHQLGAGLLAGIAAAHAAGLVHRDLKPENVLIGTDGVPRTADFGLARAADRTRGFTAQGVGIGTPGYMAPEAYVDAASVDHRADVYSLGCVLYEMCSGVRAFPAGLPVVDLARRARRAQIEPLERVVADVPAGVVDVVMQALEPDPAHRQESAAALRAAWRDAWVGA